LFNLSSQMSSGELEDTTSRATQVSKYIDDLNNGREVVLKVGDRKWEPHLKEGDFMVFGAPNLEKLGPGAIVLFRAGERLIVRRVVKKTFIKTDIMLLIKPIQGKAVEAPIKAASVLARLIHVDRTGGRVPAERLNRGLIDWLTAYGTASPLHRLTGFLAALVPGSLKAPEDTKTKQRK
jgi:hypothetical protein